MKKSYFRLRKFCPACHSTDSNQIYFRSYEETLIKNYLLSYYSEKIELNYLEGANYVLEECNKCGIIFQKEIPNDFLMKEIYEVWIDPRKSFKKYLITSNLKRSSFYIQEILMMIAYFGIHPNLLELLDFGMGWGKWCMMSGAFGCKSYGTEISEERIKYAKSKGIIILYPDELTKYKFDFINTEQIFEHIPEPLNTLKYLRKLLKPHGIIKINVPNGKGIKRKLKKVNWEEPKDLENSLMVIRPLEHINCYKRSSIIKIAKIAGLETINISITLQLAYTTNWTGITQILKNVAIPFYRNVLRRGTYLFFKKSIM